MTPLEGILAGSIAANLILISGLLWLVFVTIPARDARHDAAMTRKENLIEMAHKEKSALRDKMANEQTNTFAMLAKSHERAVQRIVDSRLGDVKQIAEMIKQERDNTIAQLNKRAQEGLAKAHNAEETEI